MHLSLGEHPVERSETENSLTEVIFHTSYATNVFLDREVTGVLCVVLGAYYTIYHQREACTSFLRPSPVFSICFNITLIILLFVYY